MNIEKFIIYLGLVAIVLPFILDYVLRLILKKNVETLNCKHRFIIAILIIVIPLGLYYAVTQKEERQSTKESPPQKPEEKNEKSIKSTTPQNAKKAAKRMEEDPIPVDGRDQPDKFIKGVNGDKGFQIAARGIQETFDNLSFAIAAKNWSRVSGFFHNDFKAKGTKGYLSKEDWISMLKDSGEITFEFRAIIRDEGTNSKLVKIETMRQGKLFQETYSVAKTGNSWQIISKF